MDGVEAGRRLIANQLAGITRATSLGLTIKINTVLIPTLNDHHIGEVAAAVAKAGARMINIIPLIPEHQLSHLKEPSFIELHKACAAAQIASGLLPPSSDTGGRDKGLCSFRWRWASSIATLEPRWRSGTTR